MTLWISRNYNIQVRPYMFEGRRSGLPMERPLRYCSVSHRQSTQTADLATPRIAPFLQSWAGRPSRAVCTLGHSDIPIPIRDIHVNTDLISAFPRLHVNSKPILNGRTASVPALITAGCKSKITLDRGSNSALVCSPSSQLQVEGVGSKPSPECFAHQFRQRSRRSARGGISVC
ncbi:hypothetical protein BV20DRAFT_734223 [Pilatotrama ljubarskyi]|nr:hypothetical protein BV20DRAFT_734223 [Pilatotrama ljubarskyi]